MKKASKAAVICYGLGDLASQFIWTFVGTYLSAFYTDVVGFSTAVVAGIMLIARIWDAVNDPMMGTIAENKTTRFGRFRPYLAFGSPLLAIFAVLTFVNYGTDNKGIILSAVVYIIAGMLYTLVNIPYSSLASVMTEDSDQRNKIGVSRSVGMNLGMLIVNGCSAGMMLFFSGNGAEVANSRGYMMTAVVYSIIAVPLFWIVFATSKEVIGKKTEAQKISPKQTLKNIFTNRYLLVIFLVATMQMTAFMGRIAITYYYCMACLQSFAKMALIMTIPSIGGIIGSFFVTIPVKKFGKKKVLAFTLFGQGLGLLIVYLSPFSNMTMILAGHWIYGLFNCGFPLFLSMVADSIDFQEQKTGVRTDGSFYAMYGLSTKLGNALGSAIGVVMIFGFGYVASSAMEQTAAAQAGVNLTVNLIPSILMFAAGIILLLLWNKSDADFDRIREENSKRHAAAAE